MKDYNKLKSVIQNPQKHSKNQNILEMFVYFFFYTVLFSFLTQFPTTTFQQIDWQNKESLEQFFQTVGELYRKTEFKKLMKNIIYPPTIFDQKNSITSMFTLIAFKNFQFGTLLGTFITIIFYMMSKFGFKMLFSPLGTYVSEFLIRIGFSKTTALGVKKSIDQTLRNIDSVFDYISSYIFIKSNAASLVESITNVLKNNFSFGEEYIGWIVAIMLSLLGYTILNIFLKVKELLKKDKKVILSDSIEGIRKLLKDEKKKTKKKKTNPGKTNRSKTINK